PGDHRDRRAAERRAPVAPADRDHGPFRGELARCELVRLEHRRHRLDAGKRAKRDLFEQRFVADATDDRAVLAAREMRAHADRLDAFADVVDFGVGDFGSSDDDHLRWTLDVERGTLTKTKTTREVHGSSGM